MGYYYLGSVLFFVALSANSVHTSGDINRRIVKRDSHDETNGQTASVIYTCAKFFNYNIELLFPAIRTRGQTSTTTAAALSFETSMETFCSRHDNYTSCVQDGLRSPVSNIDRVVKAVMNTDNFQFYIEKLCQKASTLADQFVCTYEAIESSQSQCGSQIENFLNSMRGSFVLSGTIDDAAQTICSLVSSDLDCYSGVVGRNCDQGYAETMANIFRGYFQPSCLMSNNEIGTDLLPCVYAYSLEVAERAMAVFENLAPENNAFMSNIIDFIGDEMDLVCNNHIQTMAPCIKEKLALSTKPIDLMIKQMVAYKRIDETLQHFCSMVPNFKQHALCMANNIYAMVTRGSSACFQSVIQKFTMVFGENVEVGEISRKTDEICSAIELSMTCFKPELSECSTDLADQIEELVWKVSTCRDPVSSAVKSTTHKNIIFVLSIFVLLSHV